VDLYPFFFLPFHFCGYYKAVSFHKLSNEVFKLSPCSNVICSFLGNSPASEF